MLDALLNRHDEANIVSYSAGMGYHGSHADQY